VVSQIYIYIIIIIRLFSDDTDAELSSRSRIGRDRIEIGNLNWHGAIKERPAIHASTQKLIVATIDEPYSDENLH
jgi:hypothetical protein